MQSTQYHLYSSIGCHLCEQAYELCLAQVDEAQIKVVDILDDDDKEPEEEGSLYKKYGISIPVVKKLSDDSELYWPFDAQALSQFVK